MTHILIVDDDQPFALSLQKALRELDNSYTVTAVTTAVEARILLASQPQDVAFVSPTPQGEMMYALRAIQPDLRLILMIPAPTFAVPDLYTGMVQGLLIRPLLHTDLQNLLAQTLPRRLGQPLGRSLTPQPTISRQRQASPPLADNPAVIDVLQKADLGQLVKTAVFTRGSRLIGYWGDLTDTQATAVAQHIGRTWNDGNQRVQIQFLHLPTHSGDLLLYTRYITDQFLLTLVSLPKTPISELHRRADQMADILRDTLAGETIPLTQPVIQASDRKTYALVWRPRTPLSTALHIPLRRIIERLATTNGCLLTYINVQSNLIHVVVNCAPEQSSSWVVLLLKNGTEKAIQQEYGMTSINLWESGYYAEERERPLRQAELQVFLEKKKVTSK